MAPIRHYGGHFQEDGCETKQGWVAGRLFGGEYGPCVRIAYWDRARLSNARHN